MKNILTLALLLITVNAFAKTIDCTTIFKKAIAGEEPETTYCGQVSVESSDNGIKYRKIPKNCEKFIVEFFSINSSDDPKFTQYCDKIFSKNCYRVGITDRASREGMNGLSADIVLPSINSLPIVFNLEAHGLGHKRGLPVGPGTLVWIDLSCRVSP